MSGGVLDLYERAAGIRAPAGAIVSALASADAIGKKERGAYESASLGQAPASAREIVALLSNAYTLLEASDSGGSGGRGAGAGREAASKYLQSALDGARSLPWLSGGDNGVAWDSLSHLLASGCATSTAAAGDESMILAVINRCLRAARRASVLASAREDVAGRDVFGSWREPSVDLLEGEGGRQSRPMAESRM